jgi:hypothetical protein
MSSIKMTTTFGRTSADDEEIQNERAIRRMRMGRDVMSNE